MASEIRNSNKVWTIHSVSRPTPDGYAFVAVRPEWDSKRDIFTLDVDDCAHQWHRRGSPIFKTRSAAIEYVKKHGWPLG